MVEWIVSSSVLIAVVLLLRRVLKGRISLRLQYALWVLVLARLLIPVSFGGTAISVGNLTQKAAESEPVRVITDLAETQVPVFREQWTGEKPMQGDTVAAAPVIGDGGQQTADGASVPDVLKAIWLSGVAAVGAWFLISNLRLRRMLRKSRVLLEYGSDLPVYVSGAVETPCLFGLPRPAIYLTKAASGQEIVMRHAVEHELTHYRHGDHIWAILRCVCLAVHWYNPLVWWAAVCSRNDAELACDEMTIKRLGEGERAAYGRTLIGLTCEKRPALLSTATTMTGSGRSIRERIALIVKKPKMAAYTAVAVVLIAALAVGCTFTGADEPESGADDVTVYQCGELSAAIPNEYVDELIVYAGADTGEENVLLKVYGKAVTQAFAAAGVGEDDSMGWIFSIVRRDQAWYDENVSSLFLGDERFAYDGTWYYCCIQSSDSTFYPTGDMADQERWEELWTTMVEEIKADFITRNSLMDLNAESAWENVKTELMNTAFQEAQTYGLDIELSQGQVLPWGDTDYEVEFPVKNTDTYILVKINRTADGSLSVVESGVVSYGLWESAFFDGDGWYIAFPTSDWVQAEVYEEWVGKQWVWKSKYGTGSMLTLDWFSTPLEVQYSDAMAQGYTALDSTRHIWERHADGVRSYYYFSKAADGGSWRVWIQWTDANITDYPSEPAALHLMAESFTMLDAKGTQEDLTADELAVAYQAALTGGLDELYGASGEAALTLYLPDQGACGTYTVSGQYYPERIRVLICGYTWTQLDAPPTQPDEYWLTLVSTDGARKMTFRANGGAGVVEYESGGETVYWAAEPAEDGFASIADDVRRCYDNLEADESRICFSVDGGSQAAAEYFMQTAFAAHRMSLSPGNWYRYTDYALLDWGLDAYGGDDMEVTGWFQYAFVPEVPDTPAVWAGSVDYGTGEYEGMLLNYFQFLLQKQEDGSWRCMEMGTGGIIH